MLYRPQTIHFLDVIRADTFHVVFEIDAAYPLTAQTRIRQQVRPVGDFPEEPLLTFDTEDGSITIAGQLITFHKEPEQMEIRPGKYVHDIQFTQEEIKTTLYRGIFEVIKDSTTL